MNCKYISLWLIFFYSVIYAPIKRSQSSSARKYKTLIVAPPKIKNMIFYPGVYKLDNNLFYGKIADQPLWCVMEKLTNQNIMLWKKYSNAQADCPGTTRNLKEGSTVFRNVISNQHLKILMKKEYDNYQTWIAYITKNPQIRHIPPSMDEYNQSSPGLEYDFAQDIEIFVTVNFNPKALITNHIGIARSVEALLFNSPHKNLSMHLHSFAAKVTKMLNPKRVYMITTPVSVMREIMIKNLPQGSVFNGTKEYLDIVKNKPIQNYYEFVSQDSTQAEIERIEMMNKKNGLESDDLIIGMKLYQEYKNIELTTKKKYEADSVQYPPVISVDDPQGFTVQHSMIIYDKIDHTKKLMSVNNQNKNIYKWIFEPTYAASSYAPYTAIDLDALANWGP